VIAGRIGGDARPGQHSGHILPGFTGGSQDLQAAVPDRWGSVAVMGNVSRQAAIGKTAGQPRKWDHRPDSPGQPPVSPDTAGASLGADPASPEPPERRVVMAK
jgi:hypothetical protein